jgi:hypothetical protein
LTPSIVLAVLFGYSVSALSSEFRGHGESPSLAHFQKMIMNNFSTFTQTLDLVFHINSVSLRHFLVVTSSWVHGSSREGNEGGEIPQEGGDHFIAQRRKRYLQ